MPRKREMEKLCARALADPVFAAEWKAKKKAEGKARRDAKHTPEYLAAREWRRTHPDDHRKAIQRKADAKRRAAYRLAHPKPIPYKDMSESEKKAVRRRVQLKLSGWTPETFASAKEAQGGRCAICGDIPEQVYKNSTELLVPDHKHGKTPIRRALLCPGCNVGIGAFKERPEACEAAYAYLRHWNKPCVG